MVRGVRTQIDVPATIDRVWAAWTTSEGARSFFAPRARIDTRLLGPYELLFSDDEEAQPGEQGSEGCRVLSFLPGRMISFEWNAPPEFGELRVQHTFVVVELEPVSGDETATEPLTRVRLSHLGYGKGAEWERLRDYFERAWWIVLSRLHERFVNGPIDWSAPYRPPVSNAGE
jgi:uncharacterized protein YndB with AHSA1/START domain